MAGFCLPKFAADELRARMDSGEVTAEKLSTMKSSAERRAALAFLGDINAKQVNTLFESKLLLKNQMKAMQDWASQILREKPHMLRDTLSKLERLDSVLSESEVTQYLHDLVEKRIGVAVTENELANLTELSARVKDAETTYNGMLAADKTLADRVYEGKETTVERNARIEYGVNRALFTEYVGALKPGSDPLTLKEFLKEPITNIAGLYKSVRASWDNGFTANQSVINLYNPLTFAKTMKNFVYSNIDFVKGALTNRELAGELKDIKSPEEFIAFIEKVGNKDLGGLPPDFAVKADVFSRPNAINGNYTRAKLAIGLHTEEAIPTVLPERIPVLGRAFRASNQAYQATAIRTRADLMDMAVRRAEKSGLDLTDKEVAESIGQVVNAATGRGSLGTGESMSKKLNVFAFSPRLLRGTFDTLTAHLFNKKVTLADKRIAARNLLLAASTFYALTMAKETLDPGSTSMDPRDAHWGQWKFGDRWYNVVGPYRPMVRAISALIPTINPKTGTWGMWHRNSSGKWVGVDFYPEKAPQYNAPVPLDVFEDFFEGKASPLMGRVITHWRGTEYGGAVVSPQSELTALTPIQLENWLENKDDPKVDNMFVETILSFLNIQGTTYKK